MSKKTPVFGADQLRAMMGMPQSTTVRFGPKKPPLMGAASGPKTPPFMGSAGGPKTPPWLGGSVRGPKKPPGMGR